MILNWECILMHWAIVNGMKFSRDKFCSLSAVLKSCHRFNSSSFVLNIKLNFLLEGCTVERVGIKQPEYRHNQFTTVSSKRTRTLA